ncbi:MAG: hypothetical protein IT376_23570 [Polyangiaceae bacterium]|nr:hypothetical protein [Polyangiaceae bacterium]
MHTNEKPKTARGIWKNAKRQDTWFTIVLKALIRCHPPAPLSKLYELIEPHPKTRGRKYWQAKVRQTLELSDTFIRTAPGMWDLSSQHSAKAVKKFERQRRRRYPRRAET